MDYFYKAKNFEIGYAEDELFFDGENLDSSKTILLKDVRSVNVNDNFVELENKDSNPKTENDYFIGFVTHALYGFWVLVGLVMWWGAYVLGNNVWWGIGLAGITTFLWIREVVKRKKEFKEKAHTIENKLNIEIEVKLDVNKFTTSFHPTSNHKETTVKFRTLPNKVFDLKVNRKEVMLGMKTKHVLESWGEPDKKKSHWDEDKKIQEFIYNKEDVTNIIKIGNDRVTSIKQEH